MSLDTTSGNLNNLTIIPSTILGIGDDKSIQPVNEGKLTTRQAAAKSLIANEIKNKQPSWYVATLANNPGIKPNTNLLEHPQFSGSNFLSELSANDGIVKSLVALLSMINFQNNAIEKMSEVCEALIKFTNELSGALATNANTLSDNLDAAHHKAEKSRMHSNKLHGFLGVLIGALAIVFAVVCAPISGGLSFALCAALSALVGVLVVSGSMQIAGGIGTLNNTSNPGSYLEMSSTGLFYKLNSENAMIAQSVLSIVMIVCTMGTSLIPNIANLIATGTENAAEGAAEVATENAALRGLANTGTAAEAQVGTATQTLANKALSALNVANLLDIISGMIASIVETKKHHSSHTAQEYAQMASSGIVSLGLYTAYNASGLENKLEKSGNEVAAICVTVALALSGFISNIALAKSSSSQKQNLFESDPAKLFQIATEFMSRAQNFVMINQLSSAMDRLISAIYNRIMVENQQNAKLTQFMAQNIDSILQSMIGTIQDISNTANNDLDNVTQIMQEFIKALIAAIDAHTQSFR